MKLTGKVAHEFVPQAGGAGGALSGRVLSWVLGTSAGWEQALLRLLTPRHWNVVK